MASRIKDPNPFTVDGTQINTYADLVVYVSNNLSTTASANKLIAAMLKTNTQKDTVFCLGHLTGEFPLNEMLRLQTILGVVHPYLGNMSVNGRMTTVNEVFYHGMDIRTRIEVLEIEKALSQSGMVRID